MTVDPKTFCTDRCEDIGDLLQEHAERIVDLWVARRAESSSRTSGLRDHMPVYVRKLGEDLADGDAPCERHESVASLHGKLRWEDGWSLDGLVADFQLLRVVLFEYLNDSPIAPIEFQDTLALSAALDAAIGASVGSYLEYSKSQLSRLNEDLEQRVQERTAVAAQRGEQLERLSRDLLRAEQRERKRLAGILHDHLQQLLVAARMRIAIMIQDGDGAASRESLIQIDELLQESVESSRNLTVELSPPVLADHGLAKALEWLAGWMHDKYGLSVAVNIQTTLQPQDEDCRAALFHAARELLFNVVKHSGAHQAQLEMATDPQREGWTSVCVSDRGQGFDPNKFKYDVGGFGLSQVRERIAMVGGKIEIVSQPGDGTRITVRVPESFLGMQDR